MTKKPLAVLVALTVISALLSGCATLPAENHSGLNVSDGWVRVSESSENVGGMTGAFAKIENHSSSDVRLIGGSAEIAGMVEIHEVVMIDSKMKMQPKEGGILIKSGESITLEPGGVHVMLMGLNQAILEGDDVTLTLDFDGAEDQTFTWPAKASLSGDEEYEPKK